MAIGTALRNKAKELIARLKRPVFLGKLIESEPPTFIQDGVDYSQPVILPQWAVQQMTGEQVAAYLREATTAFRFQFDRPYEDSQPINPVVEDPLYEWSFGTRQRVLTNTHAAYQRNPLAKAIVDFSNGFVIGDGFNLVCKNKEVESVLQAFIDDDDNQVRIYEKRCLKDLQQDGEIMLRFYQEAERVVYAPLRPWECKDIETEEGFFRRKKTYVFQQDGKDETIPAKDMLHVAINAGGYELRGRPDLFCILPWLRAYNDFLENRARVNHYLNAFLYHVKAEGTPVGLASLSAQFKQPPKPGSVAVTSSKVDISAINGQVRANDSAEDGRQLKMMVVAGVRMAEYMLGDGQNANLASATAQQLPALTKFIDYQQILIRQLWTPMFKRVIQAAIDAAVLPEEVEEQNSMGETVYEDAEVETPPVVVDAPVSEALPQPAADSQAGTDTERTANGQPPDENMPPIPEPVPQKVRMIKTLDAFEVSYEPVSGDSISEIAQAMQTFLMNDILDVQSVREEAGYDHAQIEKRMKAQKQQNLDEMAQGLKPIPPGMMGRPPIEEQPT